MMRYILAILFATLSLQTFAAESTYENLVLSKAPIDRMDMASVRRGAKTFATTCMSCHTLKYLRFDKLAAEEGITLDKMPLNVKTWPNGITPPDLSLETEVRGVDWIYTYLHSFYKDPSRPSGVNNLLVHNTGMPAILAPYQGEQVLLADPTANVGVIYKKYEWYNLLEQTLAGSMSPEEYDHMTADLVNFLAYAAEPYYADQHRIGYWVLGFLVILFVFAYMLKVEYWKDVKRFRE
jgi:ubiquinol-cytochrome c reductase cytochrome c1 subunit